MADLKLALEDAEAKPLCAGKARAALPWRRRVWTGLLPVPVIACFLGMGLSRTPETTERCGPSRLSRYRAYCAISRFLPMETAWCWQGPKQDNPHSPRG